MSRVETDVSTYALSTPLNKSEKDLEKKPPTIFSNLSLNICVSKKKIQIRKLLSQF
jgi:hypothetical protein